MKSTGKAGLDIIRFYEKGPDGGVALVAYLCPAGVWTIGWGHTRGVKQGDTCTAEQAEEWLRQDIEQVEGVVNRKIFEPINQNQFDALVSFAFNVGVTAFMGSTLRRLINAKLYADAADQFKRWNKSKGEVLEGLTKRRYKEADLFRQPVV